VKNELNPSGIQKYLCNECKVVYTPDPKPNGYSKEIKLPAVHMYVEGNSYHSITQILKVNPQNATNWVRQHKASLPAAPMPTKPKVAELDELFSFIDKKKMKSTF